MSSACCTKQLLLLGDRVDNDQIEPFILSNVRDLVVAFNESNFESIFRSEFVRGIFQICEPSDQTVESLTDILDERIKVFLRGTGDKNDAELSERRLTVLLLGAAALQLFVRNNWRTKCSDVNTVDLIPLISKSEDYIRAQLVIDGQHVSDNALYPEFLWIAQVLLGNDHFHVTNETISWWRIRCSFIHQQLVDDLSVDLHNRIDVEFVPLLDKLDNQLKIAGKSDVRLQLYLEASRIKIYYHDIVKASMLLAKAKEIAGLYIILTGILGKRTRFQQKDVAQLVAKVTICESVRNSVDGSPEKDVTNDITMLPRNIALNDDVRLEKVAFNDQESSTTPHLSPTEQALLLGLCFLLKKNSAASELKDEELLQLIVNVLAEPQCWSIQTMALFLRSQLEGNHRRTVERAMMQMQVLVDQYKVYSANGLSLIYASCLPPFWILETEFAHLLLKLGAVNSALDIYLSLHQWEDVISCCHRSNRKDKAEAFIRERMVTAETPLLWCHLGDATSQPEHYVRAWELSGYRLARAQKSLGLLHFQKKRYKESIPHFLKCVEVNAFQLEAWSCLAFAAMQVTEWDLAARAYRRCTNFESENHEIWNNLANVYLKLKDKERAWHTFREAIRCSYDDWRIWENYLLASIDCRAFSEALSAYNRIFDLKGKHVDAEILELIVAATTTTGAVDRDGNSTSRLRSELSKLFGRITASVTSDGQVWKLYARLTAINDETEETKIKVVQYMQRAHHCLSHTPNWEKDVSICQTILEVDRDLAQACLGLDPTRSVDYLSSAKLALNGTIVRLNKYHSEIESKPFESIDVLLRQLKDDLVKVTDSLESVRNVAA